MRWVALVVGLGVTVAVGGCAAKPDLVPASPGSSAVAPKLGVSYQMPLRRNPKALIYPATLKARGIEGEVGVSLLIDATGKVTRVRIVKEAPYPEFNEAARAMAETEQFDPARRDGVAMPYSIFVVYRFRVERE